MLRSIFSFFAIIAFALSFILAPAKALACEDPPPTLLALYNKSSEIHVARFEGKDDGNIVEQGEEFTAVEVHKRFSIISSLKGSLQGAFVSTDVEYRYKGIEQTETTDAEETGHGHDPNALAPGDNVLLFLRRSAEGNSLVLADYQGAAKKLSEKELRSYTKAVEDLNSIYAMSKGRDEAIVQWLVERAIDPVTRREGANELLTGFNTIDWKEMRDREIKEKIARGEELEEWEKPGYDEAGENPEYFDNTPYARLLTDSQKAQLLETAISLKAEQQGNGVNIGFSEGDSDLIDLVTRWGDSRFVEFLLKQARTEGHHEYARYQFISHAATILKDEEAKTLAEEYGIVYYYDDDEKIGDGTSETGLPPMTVKVQPGSTYKDLKNAILERFFSQCGRVLATSGTIAAS